MGLHPRGGSRLTCGARLRAPIASRSTIVATTGSTSSSVRVRSGARNSSANARLLRPSGIAPPRKTSKSSERSSSSPPAASKAACDGPGGDVVVEHEGEIAADRGEPRNLDEPEVPEAAARSGSSSSSATATRPSMSSDDAFARVQLPEDADGSTLEERSEPTARDGTARRAARRASTAFLAMLSLAFHAEILEQRLDDPASIEHVERSIVGRPALARRAAQDETRPAAAPRPGRPIGRRCPPRRSTTDPVPQRWFLAAVWSSPGSTRVRSHASSARSGFASGIASRSPSSARSSSDTNGRGLASRRPARTRDVPNPAGERVRVRQAPGLRRARDGGARHARTPGSGRPPRSGPPPVRCRPGGRGPRPRRRPTISRWVMRRASNTAAASDGVTG